DRSTVEIRHWGTLPSREHAGRNRRNRQSTSLSGLGERNDLTKIREIKKKVKGMDVIISGGTIVDGTGNKPYKADIGIERDRIAAIGNLGNIKARKIVDAKGLTITPGFIDGHT